MSSTTSLPCEAPCVIDIEASGFGLGSYPIEVGAVLPDGAAYCSLISPEPDWQHWEPTAEAVHGITREVLKAHGKPAARVASELNRCLHAQTVYTDAWYHDFQWLARLFDAADMQPQFVLKDLRQALDEAALARWDAAKTQVLDELKLNRHRASNDARVLQQTWVRVTAHAAVTSQQNRAKNIIHCSGSQRLVQTEAK